MFFKRKYAYDLHIHTDRYSPCSRILPEEVIPAALECGLDGIAIVEHDHCWSPEEIEQLKAEAGAPDFTVLAGCEVRTCNEEGPTGDLIVFGAVLERRDDWTIDQVCREAHSQGGIVMAPHPFAGSIGLRNEVFHAPIDALEIYNQRHGTPGNTRLAEEAWRRTGLAGLANSDAHFLERLGSRCTEFDVPLRTIADLIEAVLRRRCRPRPRGPARRLWGLI